MGPKIMTTPYAARGALSIALLLAVLLGATSQAVAVELPAVEAVTYDGAKVTPYEFTGDVRSLSAALPSQAPAMRPYRPLLRPPAPASPKIPLVGAPTKEAAAVSGPLAPMPSPAQNFAGMSEADACTGGTCGAGWPPDPNGDVGPNHYIQAVNDAYAIYNKTGTLLASFTENQLWSGAPASPCNGHSQGDPVVLYDWLADRWILTHFAFASTSGPFYQCIAASKTSNPVAGGWWLYAVRMDPGGAGQPPVGALNDYGKFGLWHDCLYMGANEFNITTNPETYLGVAFASFSRSDLYSGAALTWSLGFLGTATNPFTLIPSHNQGRGVDAAQPGTPNYFVSESQTAFAFEVRKFTAGTNCGGGGTLSALTNVSQTSYTYTSATMGSVVPQPNTTNKLDNLGDRIMQKVQYRKIGGAESLWVTHNVGTATGPTAMQWAQINVAGGTIVTTPMQQQIYAPDTTLWRWMGSLAVDNQGNMALGYSTSNGTSPNFPSIAYSGRLASDPLNTLPQTEVQLFVGAGSQTNNCGGAICDRWGDYTAMSVDPADGCTFWYTNQYYSSQANGTSGNWQTRIGSFKFPSCVPVPLSRTKSDFNGDGKSDILWRRAADGAETMWLMNGTSLASWAPLFSDTAWTVAGTGDFNGDGKSDILWRRASDGAVTMWLMNGTAMTSWAQLIGDPAWTVVGTGDFNGGGKTDILWRRASDGAVTMWLMNGTAVTSWAQLIGDPAWTVIGTGDFNGDGKTDILWRRASDGLVTMWLMNGTAMTSWAQLIGDTAWTVAGTGDFNGDGKTDILWRRASDGLVTMWLMNGTSMTSWGPLLGDTAWTVAGTGDFNGDGKTDILWRRAADGLVTMWLMNGTSMTSWASLLSDTAWQPVGLR
jgi:hypothetical protein